LYTISQRWVVIRKTVGEIFHKEVSKYEWDNCKIEMQCLAEAESLLKESFCKIMNQKSCINPEEMRLSFIDDVNKIIISLKN